MRQNVFNRLTKMRYHQISQKTKKLNCFWKKNQLFKVLNKTDEQELKKSIQKSNDYKIKLVRKEKNLMRLILI